MKKVAVILGGMSTENEVSQESAKSVIKNLNKTKYDVTPIYIDKSGEWYNYETKTKIENITKELKKVDVVFPVLHGLYGEDGTIQGMLEMLKIPYVGCRVLASCIGMDKAYSKIIFEKAGINQVKYIYAKVINEDNCILVDSNLEEKCINVDELVAECLNKLEFPMFIKPSNSGSSIGVGKAENREILKQCILNAAKYDKKVLIEQGIIGKEVECAVLGNSEIGVEVSRVGEIISAEDFYSYEAKYENPKSVTNIPASIEEKTASEIQQIAVKAFKSIDGSGLSRVDFFVEDNTQKIYLNEINTMPGFTNISMYPKLMEDFGYTYSGLLDKLIEIATTVQS